MKTVDELVSEWTEDERERMKDLIAECREREKQIIENSKICRENLNKLTGLFTSLFSSTNELREKTERLGDDLWGIYLRLHGKNMPCS